MTIYIWKHPVFRGTEEAQKCWLSSCSTSIAMIAPTLLVQTARHMFVLRCTEPGSVDLLAFKAFGIRSIPF